MNNRDNTRNDSAWSDPTPNQHQFQPQSPNFMADPFGDSLSTTFNDDYFDYCFDTSMDNLPPDIETNTFLCGYNNGFCPNDVDFKDAHNGQQNMSDERYTFNEDVPLISVASGQHQTVYPSYQQKYALNGAVNRKPGITKELKEDRKYSNCRTNEPMEETETKSLCRFCPETFLQKSNLDTHALPHAKDRNFSHPFKRSNCIKM